MFNGNINLTFYYYNLSGVPNNPFPGLDLINHWSSFYIVAQEGLFYCTYVNLLPKKNYKQKEPEHLPENPLGVGCIVNTTKVRVCPELLNISRNLLLYHEYDQ